jgi:hypothetical protein
MNRSELERERPGIVEEIKRSYPFREKVTEVRVRCRSGKTIKASTCEGLIASDELSKESPEHLAVELRCADVRLSIDCFDFMDSRISVSIAPSDAAVSQRLMGLVSEWAESQRLPTVFCRFRQFAFVSCLGLLFLLWACLRIGTAFQYTGPSEMMKQASQLLEHGVTAENQAEAIGLVLQINTGLFEKPQVTGFTNWYKALMIFVAGWFVAWLIAPRSLIGIGKRRWLAGFYRNVVKCVDGIVFVWFVAVVSSVMGSFIWDAIKAYTN